MLPGILSSGLWNWEYVLGYSVVYLFPLPGGERETSKPRDAWEDYTIHKPSAPAGCITPLSLEKKRFFGEAAYEVGRMQRLWIGTYAWDAPDSSRVLKVTPAQSSILQAGLGGTAPVL